MKGRAYGIEASEVEDIEKTLFITSIVTQNCDLRCWYCDVVDFSKPHRFISTDDFGKTLDFIEAQNIKNVVLRLYGGEPFIHPNIRGFVEMAKERLSGHNLDIIANTNLMRPVDTYSIEGVTLAPSFHADWVRDVDGWFDKCLYLKDKLHSVILMLQNTNHRQVEELHEKYKDSLPLLVVPIDEILGTGEYREFRETHPEMNFDDSENVLFFGGNKGTITMCSSGFIVDEDGSLYQCWRKTNEPVMNVFEQTKKVAKWHMCLGYCEECDQEVIRATVEYWTNNIKGKVYDDKPNRSVLFRCNA